MDSKDEIEKVINTMKKEMDTLNTAVLHKIDQARKCIERLQKLHNLRNVRLNLVGWNMYKLLKEYDNKLKL